MINIFDYLVGLGQFHSNEQLNITYTIRFSKSSRLDDLYIEIKKKIPKLNTFFQGLYSPYLLFTNLRVSTEIKNLSLTDDIRYQNLDLANYEFIRLDYITKENESEFVFTVSHIISDGIGVVALGYYLLNSYDLHTITSYVNYHQIKNNYIDFINKTSFHKSKLSQITKLFKRIRSSGVKTPFIDLRKYNEKAKSIPDAVKTTFSLSTVREKSKKYGISRENYLLLKFAETILRFCNDKTKSKSCILSHTQNLRLNKINLVDEAIGNYSSIKIWEFKRNCDLLFKDFVHHYIDKLNDRSYFPELVQEWLSFQKVNRLPRALLSRIVKRINIAKFTAVFTYMPMRTSILFPPDEFLKKFDTNLIDYAIYLRAVKKHVPYFMIFPNPSASYTIMVTYNRAFMDKHQAFKLLKLYENSLMEI